MRINQISLCTILTLVLLSKFDLFTCIEFSQSDPYTHNANSPSVSHQSASSSYSYSPAEDSWQDPNDVIITRTASGQSETISGTDLSQDASYSQPEHIILSSVPSDPEPGSETSQTVPESESSEAVPTPYTSDTVAVSEDSEAGTLAESSDTKPASEGSEPGEVPKPVQAPESSQVPETKTKIQLLIIDVDNKKSTNEVEYKRDDRHEFDLFTAKEGFFIYSAKKRGDRLWKSTKTNYPIGIAYKERPGDKPLLRVFHKREELTASGESTPEKQQPGSSLENEDDEIEVIEVRKPMLIAGSPTHQSNYDHKTVEYGYQSGSDTEEFSTDDENSASFSNYSDPNAPKPKYRPSKGPPPITNEDIEVIEMGPRPQQNVRIGTAHSAHPSSISLTDLNDQIARFAAELEKLSKSLTQSVQASSSKAEDEQAEAEAEASEDPSAPKAQIEIEDLGPTDPEYAKSQASEEPSGKSADSEDSYGFIQGYFDIQMVEFYCGDDDSNHSHRISHVSEPVTVQTTPYGSDQETIETLYGKGVRYEKAHLGSRGTASGVDTLEDDDMVIDDSRCGQEQEHGERGASDELSHEVITVFEMPRPLPLLMPQPFIFYPHQIPRVPERPLQIPRISERPPQIPRVAERPPQIPRVAERPRQRPLKEQTISYDPRLRDNLLSEPPVDPGIHAHTMIYIPRREYEKVVGFPQPRRPSRIILLYRAHTLDLKARFLKIYTLDEKGIIYENDTTKYHLTKGADVYTYTLHSSVKCFMIKYKDKEWIHNPLTPYPGRILLSRNNLRIEFRQHGTLLPQI
ncbi:conserved hypothetical protein [Theileria orientalis strain Shintoku]|uniref:Uncharacterized protein n=1 Tax=Theileria orientalis strain Shintoku TaxID=869250 RepID=J7MF74_THEOR|nr:conserved hypothetical protein [Theileria orientalis strain Shintoku]BAM42489.1 conserved hypothetical protein [Theileria orientalis strain Shintoku]|eukprot:XP_009692790.1 conserved hypothetical protein [Theileria orientalis strain Shintoku]